MQPLMTKMKISMKKNIFLVLVITILIAVIIYQYCQNNDNSCRMYSFAVTQYSSIFAPPAPSKFGVDLFKKGVTDESFKTFGNKSTTRNIPLPSKDSPVNTDSEKRLQRMERVDLTITDDDQDELVLAQPTTRNGHVPLRNSTLVFDFSLDKDGRPTIMGHEARWAGQGKANESLVSSLNDMNGKSRNRTSSSKRSAHGHGVHPLTRTLPAIRDEIPISSDAGGVKSLGNDGAFLGHVRKSSTSSTSRSRWYLQKHLHALSNMMNIRLNSSRLSSSASLGRSNSNFLGIKLSARDGNSAFSREERRNASSRPEASSTTLSTRQKDGKKFTYMKPAPPFISFLKAEPPLQKSVSRRQPSNRINSNKVPIISSNLGHINSSIFEPNNNSYHLIQDMGSHTLAKLNTNSSLDTETMMPSHGLSQATDRRMIKPWKGIVSFSGLSCKPLRVKLLLFNRIFKTGSTSIETFIEETSLSNNFTWLRATTEDWYSTGNSYPYPGIIEEFAKNLTEKYYGAFAAHFYFRRDLNISQRYTYIGVLRGPVRRVVSHYHYMRLESYRPKHRIIELKDSGQWNETLKACVLNQRKECKDNVMTNFFCGSESFCQTGSARALGRAKYNMRRYYAAIGLQEKLSSFLSILRRRLPKFFLSDVGNFYHEKENYNLDYFTEVPRETLDLIRLRNKADIELYRFAKQRFEKQFKLCTS